ncbi:hypothetical protein [Formosa sp. PL04]|uniref:hypothetical protein n=1 Tax=Formosa sp. PL04 TaxID=3081755 RepID=UPI002981D393|nr:hypothetical protein [Formosa sp. PL04]MDW5290060.1 hypothetical protein [Formosa sp. PL04]
MAQDIRNLFEADKDKGDDEGLSQGHEARFLEKLNNALPEEKSEPSFNWISVAASLVVLFALSFGGYTYFNSNQIEIEQNPVAIETEVIPVIKTKTLGDLSPDLKKVEDYYLASIHTELSKVELTPENKELIDGYIQHLEELTIEYKKLSIELTESGPSELTVNALIDNLKLRLNLLYRLRDQLRELKTVPVANEASEQSI